MASETQSQRLLFVSTSACVGKRDEKANESQRRAHVMNDYLRRKKSQGSDPVTIPVSGNKSKELRFCLTSSGLESKLSYRQRSQKRKAEYGRDISTTGSQRQCESVIAQWPKQSKPRGLFGLQMASLPPPLILPFELDAVDEALLHRFHRYKRWPWCPISGQSSWLTFAVSDRMVFHATMYSSTIHFQKHHPDQGPQHVAVLKHKLAAIRMINVSISKPESALADETLAAVCAMTNIELWFGEAEEARRHMDGLHALITARGGINSLSHGIQRLLQRLSSWNDLTASQLYGMPLRLQPNDVWEEGWLLSTQSTLPSMLTRLSLNELTAAGSTPHELIVALQRIQQLCHIERLNPLLSLNDSDQMIRTDALSYIERRLQSLIRTAELSRMYHTSTDIWNAVSLCAAIYVNHFLRGNPLTYRNYSIWVPKLHDTLLRSGPRLNELAFAPSTLLWVRAIGALASQFQEMHEWFLNGLVELCMAWDLDWEGFRTMLAGFLWAGEQDGARYMTVWQQVAPHLTTHRR